ncbi:MAG: acid phosphatase [Bacteroidetes bacterium 43-16]|nr:MAG: acid phosphatase [Bacteroidetes bacterium 43-16]
MKQFPLFLLLLLFTYAHSSQAQKSAIATRIAEEKASGYADGFNTNIALSDQSLNFLVIGDWGRHGGYHQKAVAGQMAKVAATADVNFIISVGDNFYPDGVQSAQDPSWNSSFENIYSNHMLFSDWWVVLGNHDYKGNIQAQIDYSKISRRWNMPATYFSRKIKLENGKELLLVFLDTNPFVTSYYEKSGNMRENLALQDTAAQYKWLKETLADTATNIHWKIVVGHHPMYSGGMRKGKKDTEEIRLKFESLFNAHKVDAYICGHEHDLQIIKPAQQFTTQFLSGAACEVRPSGATEGTEFWAADPGMMLFSLSPKELKIQVIHADGRILHRKKISR